MMTNKKSPGVDLIAAEREKQLDYYAPDHDDIHTKRELTRAAMAYLYSYLGGNPVSIRNRLMSFEFWPWDDAGFHPNTDNPIADLTKAGAFIAAEIDRLKRIRP
jgi:hypothetical protein